MAPFAQPTPDENLINGWNVQGNFTAAATVGIPGAGFAQAALTPAVTVQGQTSAGFPNPPGAGNVGSENSAAYTSQILVNGSYSASPTTSLSQTATAPLPVTANGVQQPYGVNTTAAITGASITSIKTAPFQASGVPATGSGVWTTVWTGTASGNPISVSVPPAGYILTVGGNATAVVYTPSN